MNLNPGIVKVVKLLNDRGFVTTDSGDGETHDHSCDREEGYVVILLQDHQPLESSADAVVKILTEMGVEIGSEPGKVHVQASYSPIDGLRLVDVSGIHDRMIMNTIVGSLVS